MSVAVIVVLDVGWEDEPKITSMRAAMTTSRACGTHSASKLNILHLRRQIFKMANSCGGVVRANMIVIVGDSGRTRLWKLSV